MLESPIENILMLELYEEMYDEVRFEDFSIIDNIAEQVYD